MPASVYQRRILPWLIHLAMRQPRLDAYRRRATAAAKGLVLEIGAGSGINFPLYSDAVRRVIALEPSCELLAMARTRAVEANPPVALIRASAESIPLCDDSVDTILTTWTLCTIPNGTLALAEMRRVLKPDGRLLFVEHGLAPELGVRRWQRRLTPAWKRVGGGCHLDRPIADMIAEAGFEFEALDTGYMKGPRPMTFMYEGRAGPRREAPGG